MTPNFPFRVGEYADEIVDADGRSVLMLYGGKWLESIRSVVLSPDEVALRDFVIEACNKFQSSGAASTRATGRSGHNTSESQKPLLTASGPSGCQVDSGTASTQSGPQNSFRGDTITSLEQMVQIAEGK